MSTLDGQRLTKHFTGLIEQGPLRLTLRPVQNRTSFGITLPHEPWYSNSMAFITLNVHSDGKSLTGSSTSNEEFHLLPQFDLEQTTSPDRQSDRADAFRSFDESDDSSTAWRISKRNYKSLTGKADQTWIFTRSSETGGDFTWTSGEVTLCAGTYTEKNGEDSLDISISVGRSKQFYRCRYSAGTKTVRVCVPKNAGDPRPTTISIQSGHVYDLVRIEAEAM